MYNVEDVMLAVMLLNARVTLKLKFVTPPFVSKKYPALGMSSSPGSEGIGQVMVNVANPVTQFIDSFGTLKLKFLDRFIPFTAPENPILELDVICAARFMTISILKIIQWVNPALLGEMLNAPDIVLPNTVAAPSDTKLSMGAPLCWELTPGIKIGDITYPCGFG